MGNRVGTSEIQKYEAKEDEGEAGNIVRACYLS